MNRQCTFELCKDENSNVYPICKNSIHSVSASTGLLVFSFLFILFGLVYFISNILPSPIPLKTNTFENTSQPFIAERAQADFKRLTDIGPRVVGSCENEDLTVNFLKAQLKCIQKNVHANQKLELSVQIASGAYYSMVDSYGMLNSYGSVQSIVVKLIGKEGCKKGGSKKGSKKEGLKNEGSNNESSNTEGSKSKATKKKSFNNEGLKNGDEGNSHKESFNILINSHFDTFPATSAASDPVIMCAIMLEILRALTKNPERLDHNLIFLFNGGGEPSQASNRFITHHKWGKDVKVLINLEARGEGGKALFFHTGFHGLCLRNYGRKLPHPYGQVFVEEVFWRDFVFQRDFGDISSYKFAFLSNRCKFHKYDRLFNIPLGSYQHVGDNLLMLLEHLGKSQISSSCQKSQEKIIYYDVFGLFMVSYTISLSYIINSTVAILSIAVMVKAFMDFSLGFFKSLKCIFLTLCELFTGWICSLVFVSTIVFTLNCLGYSMCWYCNPWLIFGLFCVPTILFSCAVTLIFNCFNSNKKLCISALSQIQIHCTRFIWTLLLLIGTLVRFRSSYVFLILVLFNTFAFLVIQIFRLQCGVRKWQIVYLLSSIIPTAFIFYISITMMTIFMSSTGKIGSEKTSDLFIGVTSVLFTVLAFGSQHISRTFYDEKGRLYQKDAGFLLVYADGNYPKILQKYIKNFKQTVCIDRCCDHHLLCGMPFVHSTMANIMEQSTWIPSASPVSLRPVSIKLNSKKNLGNVTRFSFTASGPDHINIYFAPKEGLILKVITVNSFAQLNIYENYTNKNKYNINDSRIRKNLVVWKNRTLHFIKHVWGRKSTPLRFSLDIETTAKWVGPMVDIAVTGQHLHEKNGTYSEDYLVFLKQLPDWLKINTGFATYVVQMF